MDEWKTWHKCCCQNEFYRDVKLNLAQGAQTQRSNRRSRAEEVKRQFNDENQTFFRINMNQNGQHTILSNINEFEHQILWPEMYLPCPERRGIFDLFCCLKRDKRYTWSLLNMFNCVWVFPLKYALWSKFISIIFIWDFKTWQFEVTLTGVKMLV